MLFRKKPVVIEAFQYDGDLQASDGHYYVPQWAVDAHKSGVMYCGLVSGKLYIRTLEGIYNVSVGDYVIQGVTGEIYPCKPDIFEKTYEPLKEVE